MKEKGKRMANGAMKWIKAHFDELQFYSLEQYMREGEEISEVRVRSCVSVGEDCLNRLWGRLHITNYY